VVSSFFGKEDNYTEAYMNAGIPVFDGPEKAASAMTTLWKRTEITERQNESSIRIPEAAPEATEIIENARSGGRTTLDEYEAKRLLALYGAPVTEEKLAASEDDAIQAAGRIGYPLALKACSPDILHKTEKGLVHLSIKDEENVARAFAAIQKGAEENVPVLVQKMLSGKRECVAGMKRFPGFGPAVLFGLGGIYTELINDSTLRVAPFALEDGMEMLDELRTSAMLGEFRGMPAVDRETMASLLQSVGFLAHLHPEILEMDLNPIILEGSKPVVADALVVLSG
jgi:acetyltransferase